MMCKTNSTKIIERERMIYMAAHIDYSQYNNTAISQLLWYRKQYALRLLRNASKSEIETEELNLLIDQCNNSIREILGL